VRYEADEKGLLRLRPDRGLFDDESSVDDGPDVGARALVPLQERPALERYRPPEPGRSWRNAGRLMALVGGSAVIGVGVASGIVTLPAAGFFSVVLATGQVLAQTWRQNRLGQSVVSGIALGDLPAARRAAEHALVESPSGVMRTLAASNLASVLIQQDLVREAGDLLDRHPTGFFHMPLTTVLWLNNRAFAHLALTLSGEEDTAATAAELLDEAERRHKKASARDLGGPENARKLASALAGTRAIERVVAKDGKGALRALRQASAVDDAQATPFRTAERELCRTEALRLLGRKDEATITLESLIDQPLTERQQRRHAVLSSSLGLGESTDERARDATSEGLVRAGGLEPPR
jgi:hypothetical protein